MNNKQVRNQIINYVIAGIENGIFPPGERLPSQREMGEQFSVDKMTVREAMKILEDRGIITVRRGSGAYVNVLTSLHMKYEEEPYNQLVELEHIGNCITMIKLASLRNVVTKGTQKEIDFLSKMARSYHQKLSSTTPLKDRYLHYISLEFKIVEYSHNPLLQVLFAELIDYLGEIITLSCTDYNLHCRLVDLDLCLCEALNDRDLERALYLTKERAHILRSLRSEMKHTIAKKYHIKCKALLESSTEVDL